LLADLDLAQHNTELYRTPYTSNVVDTARGRRQSDETVQEFGHVNVPQKNSGCANESHVTSA